MRIGMVGPAPSGMGGICAVVRSWQGSETLRGSDLRYFATAADGRKRDKARAGLAGLSGLVGAVGAGFRPDLFHVHVGGSTSLLRKAAVVPVAARAAPVVLHVHGSNIIEAFADRSPAHGALVRRILSQGEVVLTVSEHMARIVREWVPDRPVRRLYNPVDASRFDSVLHQPRPERPTVLFMGELVDRKGVFDLLAAADALRGELADLRVRICGEGAHRDRLAEEVRRRGLSDVVELPGWLRGDEWLAAFADAHVFCLPSHSEGLPVSVLEAMAAGLPVVSTAIAGIPECTIDGETGLLHAPRDVEALTDALRRLLSDDGLRARMGVAGRRRVETTFDREVVARELYEHWADVAGHPTSTRREAW